MPQELQGPLALFSKTYRIRRSGKILGKSQGFMDMPMEVVFEVSLLVPCLQNVDAPMLEAPLPDCHVSRSKGSPASFPDLETI